MARENHRPGSQCSLFVILRAAALVAILISSGCAGFRLPQAPEYEVVFVGQTEADSFETVEIHGNWVVLDGDKYVPREAILMITPKLYPISPPPGLEVLTAQRKLR